MNRAVVIRQVRTGSRLHWGLFSEPWEGGRRHRGIGMMIQQPHCCVRLIQTGDEKRLQLTGFEKEPGLQSLIANLQNRLAGNAVCGTLELVSSIPRHVGLGSGTQLALAVTSLLCPQAEQADQKQQMTELAGRAKRSSIGAHGFFAGGGFVDLGKQPNQATIELAGVHRFELPEQWRFLLITPSMELGYSGQQEVDVFQSLDPMSESQARQAAAIAEQLPQQVVHFQQFGQSLTEFGQLVGEVFARLQGGVYRWPQAETLRKQLHTIGVQGFGQSSWGPMVVALCKNEDHAQKAFELVRNFDPQLQQLITRPMNSGAEFSVQ